MVVSIAYSCAIPSGVSSMYKSDFEKKVMSFLKSVVLFVFRQYMYFNFEIQYCHRFYLGKCLIMTEKVNSKIQMLWAD